MLSKLLKYEWKGFCSPFLIMIAVLAGVTAVTCGIIFTIDPAYDEAVFGYSIMALVLSILLYYFGIMGCLIGTLLIIAIRFYKTCYTDQGYLTHTLPVSTRMLFNAKLLSAVLFYITMILVVAASAFLIVQVGFHHIISVGASEMGYGYAEMRSEIASAMEYLSEEFQYEFGMSFGGYMAYIGIYALIGCIANIVIILGCVSLGQLFTRHRIVGAIVAYFGAQFVQKIFGWIASIPMYSRMLTDYSASAFEYMSPTMNLSLLFVVAFAVAMYFVNLHMMTKKLNLE